jgi:CRP-like cAMP-binding protein
MLLAMGANSWGGLTRSTLSSRRIRGIVGAFASVTLGEWVLGTSVAVHAYSAGGALAVGLVGFRFAPAALGGVFTTQLASHAGHRPVLSLTALTRAVVTVFAALALAFGLPFGLVIALVWLDAAAGSGYRPAQAALLPRIARTPGELTATAAMVSNVKTSGQLLGALVGGALVALLPIPLPVAVAAALYAAAALLTLGERGTGAMRAPWIGLSAVRAGLRTLGGSSDARLIVGYSSARSLVRGLWFSLAVVVSLELLSLGPSGLGVLMAAAAGGALLAIVLTAHLVGNRRLSTWLAGGLLLCGISIVATGVADSSVPAVTLMVVWGLGMALSDVGALTLLNRIIPGRSIGPLTGVMEGTKLMSEGFGSLLAPLLLALVGTRDAVIVAGMALPLVVVAGYRSLSQIDDRAVARLDVLELLRGVPFFKPLHLEALEGIAANLQPDHRKAGSVIIKQGETNARDWYLVGDGELSVEVESFVVGALHRGDQFGERALLRGAPRAATVSALTDVDLYRLERENFLTAVGAIDLADPDGDQQSPAIDATTAVAGAPLLASVGSERLSELVRASHVTTVEPGVMIVNIGDHDDVYHVLLSGRASVIVNGDRQAELLPGDAFGEIAVLHRRARTASVIAEDRSSVLSLDGEVVRAALRESGDGALAHLVR